MFKDFKKLITSDICLSCDGCCQFDGINNDWRAKAGEAEADIIVQKAIAPKDIIADGGYLKEKLCHGIYVCEFFDTDTHKCGIYEDRPFECRLYPFVLTRCHDKPAVSVHLSCPYVQENSDSQSYEKYIIYLKKYFQRQDLKEFLQVNPHLFGDYRGYEKELAHVFNVFDKEKETT